MIDMSADTRSAIERLHASTTMTVIVVAGAGSKAVSWLLAVAGASRTVLEALVPYSPNSMTQFLGQRPEQSADAQTARDMARRAYQRAVALRNDSIPVVGVGCTAAIATDRPKRGTSRCHVAAWSPKGVTTYSLEMVKGLRDRSEEEAVVSNLVLRALADESCVHCEIPVHLDIRERIQVHSTRYEDPLKAMMDAHVSTVTIRSDGSMHADEPTNVGVLSGSFNPLHQGHYRLATVAAEILGADVTFELSITNVDKPPLTEEEVRARQVQFVGRWPVVISRASVFSQKARLFPDRTFVIGCDTAERLVDPVYYGGQEFEVMKALDEIRGLGCRFLVAGRVDGGVFHTLDDVPIPQRFEKMFAAIPESAFRCDLSSTGLRLKAERRETK